MIQRRLLVDTVMKVRVLSILKLLDHLRNSQL